MLSINRFERKKAIHLAIQAMALLKEKKMLSDNILGKVRMVIVGIIELAFKHCVSCLSASCLFSLVHFCCVYTALALI